MIRPVLLLAVSCLASSACTIGPAHVRPELPNAQSLEDGHFLRASDVRATAPLSRWWEPLDDPVLSRLVEKGLDDAPTIDAALARIRQARAGVKAGRAATLPALSASATYAYAELPGEAFGTGGGTEFYSFGIDTNWEADLWGGKQREVQGALARSAEAEAQLADAQVSLSAEIVRTYVMLRERQARESLLDEREKLEARLAEMARLRLERGTGVRQQLLAASRRLGGTQAERAGVQAEIAVLRDALAVLAGEAPGAQDALSPGPIPLPPGEVAVGDPASLLARRPDVLAAEARLAAATAGIGAAQARRFPQVSLLGLLGIGGSGIGDIVDPSQISAIALPRLSWNFLDFGRTGAEVDRARAGRDAAHADYRSAVLAALHDAEASLARFGAARIAHAKAAQSLSEAREITRLQDLRAKAGTIAEAEALEARRAEADARIADAIARAQLTKSYVTVAKALGLGWQNDPAEGG